MFFLSGIVGLLLASVSFISVSSDSEDQADTSSLDDTHANADQTDGGDELLTPPDDTAEDVPTDTAGETAGDLPDDLFDSDSDLTDSEWYGVIGDEGDDVLTGTDAGEQIGGQGGNDTIDGGAGNDDLYGQDGDDVILGGAGDDSLQGEDGNDALSGGEGNDTLSGYMGDDTLQGDAGDDSLIGGAGADVLDGGAGNDSLLGNDDNDILSGGLGADELMGGKGDDVLNGIVPDASGGQDTDTGDFLNGGEGADTLMIGGEDWANGGEGDDLFLLGSWLDAAHSATIEDYTAGEDQIAIVYDPATVSDPQVGVEPSDTADAVWVTLNGERIAEVLDAADLAPEDVVLYTPDQVEFAAA